MALKSLINDTSADAYVIIVFLFSLGILSITYMILSDLADYFIPFYASQNTLFGTPANTDMNSTFDLLIFLLKYILIPGFISFIYWTYSKSQKPETSY